MSPTKDENPQGFSLAIIGVGRLGTAVLRGLVAEPHQGGRHCRHQKEPRTLERIVLSIRTVQRAQSLAAEFVVDCQNGVACVLEYIIADNVACARKADVVILACHPGQAGDILGEAGMAEALNGKLVISMLGGISLATLEDIISRKSPKIGQSPRCHFVLSIPNIAAAHGKSVTVVGDRSAGMPEDVLDMAKNVLERIGDMAFVERDEMPVAVALCASGTAFFSSFLGAVVDGAVECGLERTEATRWAALTMAGTAELVKAGGDPRAVTERVTTPGGATAMGLECITLGDTHATVVKAIQATARKIGLR
ncbi:putative Pyrroline-5-carboxylate reductase [Seiridium cardinale]|uniref:Pyrroline-5-carboxylate reductase n=1 Tax=Seiridium cardinale TaxID=138064 RepID=A0ABR2XWD8_9PEZI